MSDNTYDAVLVLGGGINLDGTLSESAKMQVQAAVTVYNSYDVSAFITSGLYGYKDDVKPVLSEAKGYATYAETLGIDPSKIIIEERSQETLGNILFTKMNILIPHKWTRILVVPQVNHLTDRIEYLLRKILGPDYDWKIIRSTINQEDQNMARETLSLKMTRQINDAFADGDHTEIYKGLLASHPAYGGTLWSVDELREKLR